MSRVYLARKNDAPVNDDSASHIIAIVENSYFGAITEAKKLDASIIAAHDMGDAGYEMIHVGPAPIEDQHTRAIVAAILFAGGTSQYKTPETAVQAARVFLDRAFQPEAIK